MTEPNLGQRLLAAATAIEDLAKMMRHENPETVKFSAREIRYEVNMWGRA